MKLSHAVAIAALPVIFLTGCGSTTETYTAYVQSVLDCTYKEDFARYIELTDSSDDDARAVYQNEIDYLVECACLTCTVKEDCMSEETAAGYQAFAEEMAGKVKYSVGGTVRSGDAYLVTVTCEPMRFWDDAFPAVADLFIKKYEDGFSKAKDPESDAAKKLESAWAEDVLTLLQNHLENVTYGEPENMVIEITTDADGTYGVSETAWLDLDDVLFGTGDNTENDSGTTENTSGTNSTPATASGTAATTSGTAAATAAPAATSVTAPATTTAGT